MNNYGFRIAKYFKVALVIGIIDLLIFYIIGKILNYTYVFTLITSKWKYITLFIAIITLSIYFIDILLFHDRTKKYKFLFIFKEPFSEWYVYLNSSIKIKKEHKKLNFYNDIYCKVKNSGKIKPIMEDEIVIRDLTIHVILTNIIVILFFFFIENIEYMMYIFFTLSIIIVYLLMLIFYRMYLKYYISEIYLEFLNSNDGK